MMRVDFKVDLRKLELVEKKVPTNTSKACREAAEALARDIRSNWSPVKPSAPFTAPAKDTGNLDSSVKVDALGRNARGQFASGDDAIAHYVRIDTTTGKNYHGRGAYEWFLEEGTERMDERPFLQPAIDRLSVMYTYFFDGVFH